MKKVCVTGAGIITSVGLNYEENHAALRNAQPGIKKARFFQSKYTESHCFGEIPFDTPAVISMAGLEGKLGITRTDALAFKAFCEAVHSAGLTAEDIASSETAFISASTVGGMCEHDALMSDVKMPENPSPFLFAFQNASHTLMLIKHFRMKGITNTINTACSSSANAIIAGVKLIRSGRAKRAIVGGVDSLSKFTVNGFNALRILSEEPTSPFNINRKGLSLGEGAAFIVLENEEDATGKKQFANISGFANAADAFHQSSLSDDGKGVVKVMRQAIQMWGLEPAQIHYVNAHGTGTDNNDVVEYNGMKEIFGTIPPYNSTKSYTGHTLGAAGAVEAVFSMMSMESGELYQSLNCNQPLGDIPPVAQLTTGVKIEHVLSNSFGFGGNCTSIILSKC